MCKLKKIIKGSIVILETTLDVLPVGNDVGISLRSAVGFEVGDELVLIEGGIVGVMVGSVVGEKLGNSEGGEVGIRPMEGELLGASSGPPLL